MGDVAGCIWKAPSTTHPRSAGIASIKRLFRDFGGTSSQWIQQQDGGHDIRVTVNGWKDSLALVGYHFGSQRLVMDSLVVDPSGSVRVSGDSELKKGVYFISSTSFYIEFLLSEQKFQLETSAEGGFEDMEVRGSLDNEMFRNYQLSTASLRGRKGEISALLKSGGEVDSLALYQQYRDLNQEIESVRDSLSRVIPDSFFAEIVNLIAPLEPPALDHIKDLTQRRREQFLHMKKHYFDRMSDPVSLMRTPMIHNFVEDYFKSYVVPAPDSIVVEVDGWLQRVQHNPEAFRYWLVSFNNKYKEDKTMGMDKVMVHLYEKYYLTGKADWIDTEARDKIEEEVSRLKPSLVGNVAPALYLTGLDGSRKNVQSMREEFLVLYFYDPNCGHCKKKTPELRDLYQQIKDMGAEVVAISTSTKREDWEKFVTDQKLEWVNLGDPDLKSNFRYEFDLRSTPRIFVLDKDRKIIAKRLDVSQVVDFLKHVTSIN